MNQRDPEYDRFGPWVLEITDEDAAPPLFVPHLDRTEIPLLSLKIPRHIERRRAHPGMDLYDYVVSLYEQDLVILQRIDHEVRAATFRYRDVQYLRVSEELLRGNLHLAMPAASYDLPYNTVSHEIMARLVDLIRGRYRPPGQGLAPGADIGPEPEGLSFYFERLLAAELASVSGMRSLAAQPETGVGAHEADTLRRILFGLVSKRLLETLHLGDGRELKIIGRGPTYAYRWQTIYGTDICFIPTANLKEARWGDGGDGGAMIDLTLSTEGGDVAYAFSADNPTLDGYRAYLRSLAGATASTG